MDDKDFEQQQKDEEDFNKMLETYDYGSHYRLLAVSLSMASGKKQTVMINCN